jgi:hypothetical protein
LTERAIEIHKARNDFIKVIEAIKSHEEERFVLSKMIERNQQIMFIADSSDR